ncbi:MAG TPA: tRNA (adenosine(37)-N6)-threonylcarbamoyltransferase complex dimerization subunit type 1 TsaB [Steroidobacteraceae bacterium]|nr:tRNA (adenosine(37)-N6)-threonylcarbamoyltransferase complex dimerization subunit type 1 TsaB [Steroidobacteraceae bacterium]
MSAHGANLRVLAIDTSTEMCSAAVLLPGGKIVLRATLTERSHAELILPMIDEVLAEAGLKLRDLDGLAFGRGPGGFTGLRIAAGVVQGLAYGAGLKVAPVSSLAAVAYLTSPAGAGEVALRAGERAFTSPAGAGEVDRRSGEGSGVLVCNDARMSELYWACYRFDPAAPCVPIELSTERVGPAASVEPVSGVTRFAGNGIPRYPELRARLEAAGLRCHDGSYPRADAVARLGAAMLARGEGVEPAEAVPTYVRDDVARPAGPPVTGMS